MGLRGLNTVACQCFEAVFQGFVDCAYAGLREKALIQNMA
jgi:hypothetical protein